MKHLTIFLTTAFILALCLPVPAMVGGTVTLNTNPRVSEFFERSKSNEAALIAFLHKMPKGADLHAHPSGSVYPEGMVDNAIAKGLFYDRTLRRFTDQQPLENFYTAAELRFDYIKYNEVLDGLSLRNTAKEKESGNVHFFSAFGRFGPALPDIEDQTREILTRAANQNISHLELMTSPVSDPDGSVNQEKTRNKLSRSNAALEAARKALTDAGQAADVSVLWSLTLYRDAAPKKDGSPDMEGYEEWWRRQVAGTLEAAYLCEDLGAVAMTVLSPEDSWISRTRFALQFRVIDEEWQAFQKKYPKNSVRMNPHGGELTLEFSPYADLTTRISDTLFKGHASRLGHGVSIMWDDAVYEVLQTMAERKIALELCLTSNAGILSVKPERHPFFLYLWAGVPLVLNTDDEGISRGNLTMEYARAAQWFGLSYGELKWLAFNSLEYSFLPGESLFVNGDFNKPKIGKAIPENSRKAEKQRHMLRDFATFEAAMLKNIALFQPRKKSR
jgi:adenosine deaminase